jgi:hypothetical protein
MNVPSTIVYRGSQYLSLSCFELLAMWLTIYQPLRPVPGLRLLVILIDLSNWTGLRKSDT